MKSYTSYNLFVGLDVNKESIAIALASPERGGEVRFYVNINAEYSAVISTRSLTESGFTNDSWTTTPSTTYKIAKSLEQDYHEF